MKYFSLNNKNHRVNFREALFNGLAPDRGLYFPESIIPLRKSFISNLSDYDKIEISLEVISQFIGDQIDEESLKKIIEHSIDFKFPLKKIRMAIQCPRPADLSIDKERKSSVVL